jgi:uncharacterized membrane protein YqjE
MFVSPPSVAFFMSVIFSFFSPLGLGHLLPLSSVFLGFLFFCFFPFLPVIYLSKKRATQPLVSKRNTRTPFFLIALVSYSVAAVIFLVSGTMIMFLPAFGYVCVTLALLIIDVFWKISAHCAGVAGPITALFYVFGVVAVPFFLLLVPLAWARVVLREHTFGQTLGGAVIAIAIAYTEYLILYP